MIHKISFLIPFIILGSFGTVNAQDTATLKVQFIGDIMGHGTQIKYAYNANTDSHDYSNTYKYVDEIFEGADLSIANLEVTLAGKPFEGYPQFSSPDELAIAVKKAGIDFLVTANNHSMDRGSKGLERTVKVLDSLEIPHTGTFRNTEEREKSYPYLIEQDSFRIALLNYTYGTNGIAVKAPNIVNMIDEDIIERDIQKAKGLNPDFIITFMHWGKEYKSEPENSQKELADRILKFGSDVVIGSHPHVIQPFDYSYNNQNKYTDITVYSLGNFVSNQRDRYRDGGMVFEMELKKNLNSGSSWINDIGYHLTWVNRIDYDQFNILPERLIRSDTFSLQDTTKYSKWNLFLSDSRGLMKKHELEEFEIKMENLPVAQEENIKPEEQYLIQIFASKNSLNKNRIPKEWRDKVLTESQNKVNKYFIGPYDSEEECYSALDDIKKQTKFKDAFVIKKEN